MNNRKSDWIADIALMGSACMWGINIPVVKYAVAHVEPLVFNASRVLFSTVALGLLAWMESRRFRQVKQEPTNWRRVLFFASLSGLLYSLLFMFGIHRTTASNAALLMATMPMWTAFLSMVFLQERLRRITWIGLVITLLGTAVVILPKGQVSLSGGHMMGNIIILGASLTWASATVVSRPLMETVGPLRLAFLSSVITTPIHWVIVLCSYDVQWGTLVDPRVAYPILYSGILSTGLAYATWNFGVQRLGGSHASVYQNVVTLVSVIGGWVALQEQMLVTQILGGLLMVVGLLTVRKGRE